MKRFTDSRRILWLGGIAILLLGVLAALTVLPNLGSEPGEGEAGVHVPKMKNIPPPRAANQEPDVDGTRDN